MRYSSFILGGIHLTKLSYFPQKLFQNLLTIAPAYAIIRVFQEGTKNKKKEKRKTKMTNAFSTRRQNKDKTEDLRRSIQHVLDEMASLREDSESRYNEYIYQLKQILPSKKESSLPAETIAARLSNDEDEQRSICASLRGLASSAIAKRLNEQWHKNHPYSICNEIDATMPALHTSMRTATRHFAELDDEGSVIRQWDEEKTTTTYYLDKEG